MNATQNPTSPGLTMHCNVHFRSAGHGRKRLTVGEAPILPVVPLGRVPWIARLMALAIRFQGLLERGDVRDYAELARLGHVTRARVTQIMNLLNLAPDLQEQILLLPPVRQGRDPLKEWQVRPIAAEAYWPRQRAMWRRLRTQSRTSGY